MRIRITESDLSRLVRECIRKINETKTYSATLPAGLSVEDIAFLSLVFSNDYRGWLYSADTRGAQVPSDARADINRVVDRGLFSQETAGIFDLIFDISISAQDARGSVPRLGQIREFILSVDSDPDGWLSSMLVKADRVGQDCFSDIFYETAASSVAPVGFSSKIDAKRGGQYFTWGSYSNLSDIRLFQGMIEYLAYVRSLGEVKDFLRLSVDLMNVMPVIDEDYADSMAKIASSGLDGMRQAVELARSMSIPD